MKTLATTLLILSTFATYGQIVDLYKKPAQQTVQVEERMLRHVVLYKFRDGIPADTLRKIEKAFYTLPEEIPEIRDFEWGINNSAEGLNKGFTHCFLLTFDSEEGRAVYLPHPAHQALWSQISSWVEDSLVLDYWVR